MATSTGDLTASGLRSSVHTSRRARVARGQVAHQPRQGQAGVDDVLNDQHVTPLDVAVEILRGCAPHPTTRWTSRRLLTAMNSICDGIGSPGEVGHEHDRALEDADQQEVFLDIGIARGDRLGELLGALLDLFLGDQDPSISSP